MNTFAALKPEIRLNI